MKRNFLAPLSIMIALGLFLFSCTKQEYLPVSTETDTEMEEVLDLLEMSTPTENAARCHQNRRHDRFQIIDIDSLPVTITAYIDSAIPSNTIHRAALHDSTTYLVLVSDTSGTKYAMKFDSTGTFVSQRTFAPRPSRGSCIDSSSLPINISSYIDTNYAGSTIKKAYQKADSSYIVIIKQADDSYLGLTFDSEGTFVSTFTIADMIGKRRGHKGKRRGRH